MEIDILLWLSGILGFLANIPYIIDIIKTQNTPEPMKPSRVSWIIWAVLDILIVATSTANGKSPLEIALPLGYAAGASFVAILSLKYGEWGNAKEAQGVMIGSTIGILIWLFAGPEVALCAFVAVLWMSAWPTIKKIWKNSRSETRLPWTMWLVASALSVIALGKPAGWTFVGSVVSMTYLLMNIPICYALFFRRK